MYMYQSLPSDARRHRHEARRMEAEVAWLHFLSRNRSRVHLESHGIVRSDPTSQAYKHIY